MRAGSSQNFCVLRALFTRPSPPRLANRRHRSAHVGARRLFAASPPRAAQPNPEGIGARGRRHEPRAARPCSPPPAAPRVRSRRAVPYSQFNRLFVADSSVVFAASLRSSRSGAGARGLLASRFHPLRRLNCSAVEAAAGPTEEAPAPSARKYVLRLPARMVFGVML
jgi:hypothetical protein